PRVADQLGARRPATAPKNLVIAKPGSRVFLVRVGDETRIGPEVSRGPLPYVADHLTAAEVAVPGWQRAHRQTAEGAQIEVGALRCGRLIAPGEAPFAPA